MKRAFTMVELIFVIVIIGILASVAISKLASTRDDAKVSTLAKAIQTLQTEIITSIAASNQVPQTTEDMKKLSNTIRDFPNFIVVNNKVIEIIDTDSNQICKIISINDNNTTDIRLFLYDGNGTSAICKGLQKLIPDNNSSGITIAGNIINF